MKGDLIKIPLKNGGFAFACLLKKPLVAFFDLRVASETIPPLDFIAAKQIAFKVWVMQDAITSGDWPLIGKVFIKPELESYPIFYKSDPISGKLSLYLGAGLEKPATFEECLGLECAAAWSANHIIERLEDHFNKRPNKWVERMKPKADKK